MTETGASDLKGLHALHQRARMLRERLESVPKTLAARKRALETKQKGVEEARLALKTRRADLHKREMVTQTARNRVDELRLKLNAVKKNEEYKAITNQIALDNSSIGRQEDEILELMAAVEAEAVELTRLEAEAQKLAAEFDRQKADFDGKAGQYRAQLQELEAAIIESEAIIPEEARERYRRSVKGQGADAFAAVDRQHPACSGCFLSITSQTLNELMIGTALVFCNTCGRILYLTDD